MPAFQIFYGPVINPVSLKAYDILPKAVFAVNEYGNIEWLFKEVEPHNLQDVLASKGYVDVDVVELKDGQFLLPGFVDTHTVRSAAQCPIEQTADKVSLGSTRRKYRTWGCKSAYFSCDLSFNNNFSGGQYQLLDWLKNVTFPTESKFADVNFARKTYESVVKRLVNGGVRHPICCMVAPDGDPDDHRLLLWNFAPRGNQGFG